MEYNTVLKNILNDVLCKLEKSHLNTIINEFNLDKSHFKTDTIAEMSIDIINTLSHKGKIEELDSYIKLNHPQTRRQVIEHRKYPLEMEITQTLIEEFNKIIYNQNIYTLNNDHEDTLIDNRKGILIDDRPDTEIDLAMTLYGTKQLPSWWTICKTIQEANTYLTELITSTKHKNILVICDRHLPIKENNKPVMWDASDDTACTLFKNYFKELEKHNFIILKHDFKENNKKTDNVDTKEKLIMFITRHSRKTQSASLYWWNRQDQPFIFLKSILNNMSLDEVSPLLWCTHKNLILDYGCNKSETLNTIKDLMIIGKFIGTNSSFDQSQDSNYLNDNGSKKFLELIKIFKKDNKITLKSDNDKDDEYTKYKNLISLNSLYWGQLNQLKFVQFIQDNSHLIPNQRSLLNFIFNSKNKDNKMFIFNNICGSYNSQKNKINTDNYLDLYKITLNHFKTRIFTKKYNVSEDLENTLNNHLIAMLENFVDKDAVINYRIFILNYDEYEFNILQFVIQKFLYVVGIENNSQVVFFFVSPQYKNNKIIESDSIQKFDTCNLKFKIVKLDADVEFFVRDLHFYESKMEDVCKI